MASQPPVTIERDYVVGGITGGSGNTVNNIHVTGMDATAAAQLAEAFSLRPAVTSGSAVEVVSVACPMTVCQVPFQVVVTRKNLILGCLVFLCACMCVCGSIRSHRCCIGHGLRYC